MGMTMVIPIEWTEIDVAIITCLFICRTSRCQEPLSIPRREVPVHRVFARQPGDAEPNRKDARFFARARELELRHARLAAFGSTCRVGGRPENDPNLQALLDSGAEVCTLVGKAWLLHVREVLRTSADENLRTVGAPRNIIEASWRALADGVEYGLRRHDLEAAASRIENARSTSSRSRMRVSSV